MLEWRRSIAQRATLLHHTEQENRFDIVSDIPERAQEWIFGLGTDLATLRNQMAQFPISFYFAIAEPQTELAGALPYLFELSERAASSRLPELRVSGTLLGGALVSFLELVAKEFLCISPDEKQAIIRAYAAEQMSEITSSRATSHQ